MSAVASHAFGSYNADSNPVNADGPTTSANDCPDESAISSGIISTAATNQTQPAAPPARTAAKPSGDTPPEPRGVVKNVANANAPKQTAADTSATSRTSPMPSCTTAPGADNPSCA